MALSPKFVQQFGDTFLDLILAFVLRAVSGIQIDILGKNIKPFAFLEAWADDLTQTAIDAYTNAATAQVEAAAAQTTADSAQSTANSAQTTASDAQTTANSASATAGSAQTAASQAQAAVGQVASNINSAIAGGVAAGTGAIASVFTTINNIFGIADSAQKTAMAAQQQLQDIQNTTPVGGFSWSTIFSGADGSALNSSDWASSQLTIIGDNGYVSVPGSLANGIYHALSQYLFTTDTQSASVVLGDVNSNFGGQDYDTTVYVRCNPAITTGAYCRINKSRIQVGKFTRSGSTWTYTAFTQASLTLKQGDIVRLKAWGDNYYVVVNGTTRLSVTDSGATVSKGSGFRQAAFSCQRSSNTFFTDNSFKVASFAMADWSPAGVDVSTPSWQLRKGAAGDTTLAIAGGGSAAMPSGFFTVNDYATDVTVSNLGTGQVTITTAGWYEIAFTAMAKVDVGRGSPYVLCPWGLYADSTLLRGPHLSGAATTVYLAAGTVVSPRAMASWPATASDGGSSTSAATRTNVATSTAQNSGIATIGGPVATFSGRKVA